MNILPPIVLLLGCALHASAFAQGTITFKGAITDDVCAGIPVTPPAKQTINPHPTTFVTNSTGCQGSLDEKKVSIHIAQHLPLRGLVEIRPEPHLINLDLDSDPLVWVITWH